MTPPWLTAITEPARDLGLAASSIDGLAVSGPDDYLRASLPVLDCAIASVASALLAAARLQSPANPPRAKLVTGEVASAFRSEAYLTVGGASFGSGFAPLSRFWPTSDGFVRTHANYPWHRAALLKAMAVTDDADVAAALAVLPSIEAEALIVAAGGVAAGVRTEEAWRTSPAGRAVGVRPLIDIEAVGDAVPRSGARGRLPASGLRVLDLTRVIAGPVATRMLAALGADVLRIDPPDLPDLPLHAVDGVHGKRSALLDADTADGRRTFDGLVEQADVVVCSYRPTSLDRLGLHPAALAYRHPGVVVASVSAWGTTGPWGTRRGFDSLVQAATGIALLQSADGVTPAALPCQLLDHASGYLTAAGILAAIARQRTDGATLGVWVSLARTAAWLLAQSRPGVHTGERLDPTPWLIDLPGGIRAVAPPGWLDGIDLRYPSGGGRYGTDAPVW
jgi:CoA-transferase family III